MNTARLHFYSTYIICVCIRIYNKTNRNELPCAGGTYMGVLQACVYVYIICTYTRVYGKIRGHGCKRKPGVKENRVEEREVK